jgi:20S proteasome alpha/beta subunit
MTIVAGFPGNGFVVLAADSDETGGLTKSSVRKIAVIDKADCKCIIGGAGNGDFIDLAVQQLNAELQPPFSVSAINELIEDIVTQIYADRIDTYPAHEQDSLGFELLCAVWVKDDQLAPQLIRVRRALHLVRTAPETIGIGSYLARYLIATLARPQMSLMNAYRLAVYLVAQVKKHAQDCGGSSQVIGITSDGTTVQLWPATITQHEYTASVVMERAMPFLLYTTDPHAIDAERINKAVDFAAEQIKKELAVILPLLPAPPAPPQPELPLGAAAAVSDATEASTVEAVPQPTPSAPIDQQAEQPMRRVGPESTRGRRALPPWRE